VVGTPATSMLFFTVIGTPCNDLSDAPDTCARSAATAARMASSGSAVVDRLPGGALGPGQRRLRHVHRTELTDGQCITHLHKHEVRDIAARPGCRRPAPATNSNALPTSASGNARNAEATSRCCRTYGNNASSRSSEWSRPISSASILRSYSRSTSTPPCRTRVEPKECFGVIFSVTAPGATTPSM
jgi:hypothetical protein